MKSTPFSPMSAPLQPGSFTSGTRGYGMLSHVWVFAGYHTHLLDVWAYTPTGNAARRSLTHHDNFVY